MAVILGDHSTARIFVIGSAPQGRLQLHACDSRLEDDFYNNSNIISSQNNNNNSNNINNNNNNNNNNTQDWKMTCGGMQGSGRPTRSSCFVAAASTVLA
jgi:hypothetical protein